MSDYLQRLVERHLGNTAPVMPNANSYVSVGAVLPASPVPSAPADEISSGERLQHAIPQRTNNASGAPESVAVVDRGVGETSTREPSATTSNLNQDNAAASLAVTGRTTPQPAVRDDASPITHRPNITSKFGVEPAASGQVPRGAHRVTAVASSTLTDVGDTELPSTSETAGPTPATLDVTSPRNGQHDQARHKVSLSQPTRAAVAADPASLAPTVNGAVLKLRSSSAEYSELLNRTLPATPVPIAAKLDPLTRAHRQIAVAADPASLAPTVNGAVLKLRSSSAEYSELLNRTLPATPVPPSDTAPISSLAARATSAPLTSVRDTSAVVTVDTPTATVPAWIPPIRPAANAVPLSVPSTPPAPNISITIGTIEVRATAPIPVPAAAPPRAGPRLSLDDYLRRRNGGST